MGKRKKKENDIQADLIPEIKKRFPDCIVTKLDANHIQGIPDLLVLYGKHWATLECKTDAKAPHQPNQDDYVALMNSMSFSSFVYPENKEDVLNGMEQAFRD